MSTVAVRLMVFGLLILLVVPVQANQVMNQLTKPNLKIGDYVTFGLYNQAPILWRVIHLDSQNDPLLFSEHILSLKSFDASGEYHLNKADPDQEDRLIGGSNYYPDSNIRQWLNSSASSISWLQNTPNAQHLLENSNPYDKERGFLADGNFTSSERNMIKFLTHKIILSEVDIARKTGGVIGHLYEGELADILQNYDANAIYKNVTDSVFLLSVKQLKEFVYDRGYQVRAKPTKEAVAQSKYQDPLLRTDLYWPYWLNTAESDETYSETVRTVNVNSEIDGEVDGEIANNDTIGVRPALYLNMSLVKVNGSGDGSSQNPYRFGDLQSPKKSLQVIGDRVILNGKQLQFANGVKPAIIKGTTMVPFRTIFSELGFTVQWSSKTKQIVANSKEYQIQMQVGQKTATVNQTVKSLQSPPLVIKGVTMVPLRFIAEQTGIQVTYRKN